MRQGAIFHYLDALFTFNFDVSTFNFLPYIPSGSFLCFA